MLAGNKDFERIHGNLSGKSLQITSFLTEILKIAKKILSNMCFLQIFIP